MKILARRRIIRNFVASLLTSDISKSDIYELISELQSGRFSYELADVLRDVAMILRDEPERYMGPPVHDFEDPSEIAFAFVQKRKMSKRALIDAISGLGGIRPTKTAQAGTTKQLLEWYFAEATPAQADKLLSLLGGDKQDPYLKGIVKRG